MKIYNKEDFYAALSTGGTVAEIGVLTGENAKTIKRINNPDKFVLIDYWSFLSDEENFTHFGSRPVSWGKIFENARKPFLGESNVFFVAALSWDAADLFPDGYFDWVYVDASHTYEDCAKDLEAWYPKVKNGGFLCGHDYSENEIATAKGWGVKRAVDEFINNKNLSIEFISNEIAARYAIRVRH